MSDNGNVDLDDGDLERCEEIEEILKNMEKPQILEPNVQEPNVKEHAVQEHAVQEPRVQEHAVPIPKVPSWFVNIPNGCITGFNEGSVIFFDGVHFVGINLHGKLTATELNVSRKFRNINNSYAIPENAEIYTVSSASVCDQIGDEYFRNWLITTAEDIQYQLSGIYPVILSDTTSKVPLRILRGLPKIEYRHKKGCPPPYNPSPADGFPLYLSDGERWRLVETQEDKIRYLLKTYGEISGAEFQTKFKEFFGHKVDVPKNMKLGQYLSINGVSKRDDSNTPPLPFFFIEEEPSAIKAISVKDLKEKLGQSEISQSKKTLEVEKDLRKEFKEREEAFREAFREALREALRKEFEEREEALRQSYEERIKTLQLAYEEELLLSDSKISEFCSSSNKSLKNEYHDIVDKISESFNEMEIRRTILTSNPNPNQENLDLFKIAEESFSLLVIRRDELWFLIHPNFVQKTL